MKQPTKLTFLGTGGGRFATIYQKRATGGIYMRDSLNLHIDPGPGALLQLLEAGFDPKATNGILISHAHPDHYGDAEILMEGMTCGCTTRKGLLAASKSVIQGNGKYGPAVSGYHMENIERVETVAPGSSFFFGDLEIRAGSAYHSDSTTVGYNIMTKNGQISYIPDTAFNKELISHYKGAKVLILSNTRPLHTRILHHLETEDSAKLIKEINPELALLTHLGYKMASNSPEKEGEWIYNETGIRTLTAEDFMKVTIFEDSIETRR